MGVITESMVFQGKVQFGQTPELPDGTVDNDAVVSLADIDAAKLEAETIITYSQTGTIVAATEYVHIVRGSSGTLVALEAAITETIATGGDRTVDIDIQKSTGAGAFATVLSATIQFDSADVLRTLSAGAFSSTSLTDGDLLAIVITVAGSAGNQAEGLIATLTVREKKQS